MDTRRLLPHRIVGFVIVFCMLFSGYQPSPVAAAGVTWYVATTGSDANSCLSSDSPCLTINGAIGKAASDDIIRVAVGTYTGSGNEVVLINKNITLSGGWNASFTTQSGMSTIDGQGARRGININNGVTSSAEKLTIQNSLLGIGNGGTLVLNNSLINSNVNYGGISNDGTLTLNNSTVSGNTSQGSGGGAGIRNSSVGILVLNNSTVSENIASNGGFGGGIQNFHGTVIINNSTITGNMADSGPGGIGINGGGSITMQNSIVAGNRRQAEAFDCYGEITSLGYNLIGDSSNCNFSAATGDLVGTNASPIDPRLTILQDNGGPTLTHALMTGSPAINAGNPASPGSGGNACLATDQRGVTRPAGGLCDIGAFEGEYPAFVIAGNTEIEGVSLSYIYGTQRTSISDGSGNYTITVPNGWSGTVTPSKTGYAFFPASRTYNDVNADQTAQNYSSIVSLKDPSFELYTPNPHWVESSTNFGTPLCTVAVCGNGGGTAGPRTGSVWGWFGGVQNHETASLSQTIHLPGSYTNLKLQFYFRIGSAAPGSDTADVFTAKVDGVTVFSANATQQALYPVYTPVVVDISAFANGSPHTITFSAVTSDQVVNFNLDDISLTNSIFFDVPMTGFGWAQIESIYNAGITGGCTTSPLNYCPNNTVTRAQMAIFLLRGIHGSSYTPPAVGDSTGFNDVPTTHSAAAWIKQLAAEGITGGCGGGNYCPNSPVTRAQMAIFLLRAKYGDDYVPPAASGTEFLDVPIGHSAGAWIEQLAAEGITGGCGGGNYCPNNPVTRAQMAIFLQRTFNLPMP